MSSKRRPVAACLTVDAVCYQPCFQLRSVRRESDLFSAERKQCSVRNTLTTLSLRVHSHSDREESTCMNTHRHVLKHNVVRETLTVLSGAFSFSLHLSQQLERPLGKKQEMLGHQVKNRAVFLLTLPFYLRKNKQSLKEQRLI